MNWILHFLIGGVVTAGMIYLAQHVNPKAAALLYAVPVQFTIAVIFIFKGTSDATIQKLTVETLYALTLFVGFILLFFFLMKKFEFWTSLGMSYLAFTVGGIIYMHL
ncbi:MAG: hypothetical protein OXR66_02835 [Candidatus Woesearchaeota archaeon]|nr:hypothetical protein [Candidatus Woesearchaeota archaeon]